MSRSSALRSTAGKAPGSVPSNSLSNGRGCCFAQSNEGVPHCRANIWGTDSCGVFLFC